MYRSGKDTVKNIYLFLSRNSRGGEGRARASAEDNGSRVTLSKDCDPKTYNESNSLLHSICDF